MDVTDHWSARMASKRSTQLIQASQFFLDRHLNTDDMEVEEDGRTDFACPYCDEDFDIVSLCTHLEDDHCFDGKLTMCPVCAAKVGSDVIGHITAQHANLFKIPRRRRFQKPRDLATNLQALLGTRATSSTDFILSSLASVYPSGSSEADEALKAELPLTSEEATNLHAGESLVSCDDPSLSAEERQKRSKQAASRAEFMQQLVLSTLWPDS